MGSLLLFWVVLVCCLALSFLLSGMEAGILALSRFRVRRQMRAGIRRAQLLHEYLEKPENFLWTEIRWPPLQLSHCWWRRSIAP